MVTGEGSQVTVAPEQHAPPQRGFRWRQMIVVLVVLALAAGTFLFFNGVLDEAGLGVLIAVLELLVAVIAFLRAD